MNSEIFLSPLPKCWDYRHAPRGVANNYFSSRFFSSVFLSPFKQLVAVSVFLERIFVCLPLGLPSRREGASRSSASSVSQRRETGRLLVPALEAFVLEGTSFLSQGGHTSVHMCTETRSHICIKHTGNL